jgi:hypothetical protein
VVRYKICEVVGEGDFTLQQGTLYQLDFVTRPLAQSDTDALAVDAATGVIVAVSASASDRLIGKSLDDSSAALPPPPPPKRLDVLAAPPTPAGYGTTIGPAPLSFP